METVKVRPPRSEKEAHAAKFCPFAKGDETGRCRGGGCAVWMWVDETEHLVSVGLYETFKRRQTMAGCRLGFCSL